MGQKKERNVLKVQELQPGQLVYSTAGRDRGKYYLVLKQLDDNYVIMVNGKNRKVLSPKKKNITHIQKTNCIIKGFTEGLVDGSIDDGKVGYLIKEALRSKIENTVDN